jgi:hypothetical protein
MTSTPSFSAGHRAALVAFAFGMAASFTPRAALADGTKAECSAAYEKSQEERSEGRLKNAREAAATCARDACPTFVKGECKQWVQELANDVPSVAIDAKDPKGEATTGVKVTIDGQEYASTLDGKPVELDPGEHDFRFEMEGAKPFEKHLTLEKGARDQALHVEFEALKSDAAPEVVKADVEAAPPSDMRSLRPFAYVAGGVGAAGLIGFAVLGAIGKSKQSDLESSCSPNCSQSDIDSVKSKYLLADISLGVGIVGLGTGVALFLLSQPKENAEPAADAKALRFDVRTSASSAYATVSGQF